MRAVAALDEQIGMDTDFGGGGRGRNGIRGL